MSRCAGHMEPACSPVRVRYWGSACPPAPSYPWPCCSGALDVMDRAQEQPAARRRKVELLLLPIALPAT